MPLTILDAVSLKGEGAQNEDACGAQGGAAWVLDGATGVAASTIAGDVSDAAWYAAEVNAELGAAVRRHPDAAAPALLRETIERVAQGYQAAIAGHEDPAFPPSAAFVMLQAHGREVAFTGLGDCAALFATAGGGVGYFEPDEERRIDNESLRRLVAEQEKTPDADHAAITARLTPVLRRNRSRMNTPEGYWILSFSLAALDHLHTRRVEVDQGAPIILMSDGFTRALAMLDGMDPARLYDAILSDGAAAIGERLRRAEAEDASCRRHPRFKKSDDATCLVVSLA